MSQNATTDAQPIRKDLVLTLTLQVTPRKGQSMEDARQEMASLLRDYFTEPEFPLLGDYSYEAWGGYDGPFIDSVRLEGTHPNVPQGVILGEYRANA